MDRVPPEVMAQIKQSAAAEWPGDFDMQKHTILKQAEAYVRVVDLRAAADTDHAFERIVSHAQSEWPGDFDMQLHTIEKQVSSREAMASVESQFSDIPPDVFSQIKQRAEREWPEDYEMQVFTIETQAAAWKDLQNL